MRFALLFPLLFLAGCGGAGTGGSKLATCFYEKHPERKVAGCTAIIESGGFVGVRLDREILATIYNVRGTTYIDLGRLKEAFKDFGEAVRLDSKNSYAWNNRGYMHFRRHEYGPAIYDLTEAIRLDPEHEFAWINRGNTYKARGELYRAAHDWERVIGIKGEPEVRKWQNFLKGLGLYTEAVDGVYNDRVWAALLTCAKNPNCWPE